MRVCKAGEIEHILTRRFAFHYAQHFAAYGIVTCNNYTRWV